MNKLSRYDEMYRELNGKPVGPDRMAIVEAVRSKPGVTPKEISIISDRTRESVRYLLHRMVKDGQIRVSDGRYYPLAKESA